MTAVAPFIRRVSMQIAGNCKRRSENPSLKRPVSPVAPE
jgi:hypothetical protein